MAKPFDFPHVSGAVSERLRSALDRVFASVGQGFNACVVARSRINELERLDAKTDDELARMGLKRDDIPRYVFRDLLHL